jgi:hypothetical protein
MVAPISHSLPVDFEHFYAMRFHGLLYICSGGLNLSFWGFWGQVVSYYTCWYRIVGTNTNNTSYEELVYRFDCCDPCVLPATPISFAVRTDDDDDDTPAWPTWAMGALFRGKDVFTPITCMLSHLVTAVCH